MSDTDNREVIQPQHTICVNVNVPSVLVVGSTTGPTMTVQWFGKADARLPEGSQFLFDILANPHDISWMGHPERFRVVFLGQVKDWPKPDKAQDVANLVAKGHMDAWIVWLVSSHAAFGGGGEKPQQLQLLSYVVKIALLGDGNCGVITPQPYLNMAVLEEEGKKVVT